jgi:peptidyl-prolyl cis-trans isomerase C
MTKSNSILLAAAMAVAVAAVPGALAVTDSTNKPSTSATLAELFGDPVIAKGDGVEIKRSQLDNEMVNIRTSLAQSRQNIPPERMMLIEREALDGLLSFKLALNKTTSEDKDKAKETFEKALAKYKADQKLTDEQFEEQQVRQLRVLGISREQWVTQSVERQLVPIFLERELGINVTDADKKKFYDENPSEFEAPESVRVCHILFSIKDPADTTADPTQRRDLSEDKKKAKYAQAQEILKRAKAGEDFAKLAREFSEDPAVKDNKGEYRFSRGDQYVEEFKAASFSLSSNQVSDIVTTLFGYHIIKQLEKIPSRKVPISEVSDRIGDFLKGRQIREKAPAYLQKLLKDAKVEILDEKLKAIELPAPRTEKPEPKK